MGVYDFLSSFYKLLATLRAMSSTVELYTGEILSGFEIHDDVGERSDVI